MIDKPVTILRWKTILVNIRAVFVKLYYSAFCVHFLNDNNNEDKTKTLIEHLTCTKAPAARPVR